MLAKMFWVGRSEWGCMGHYFGWVGVGGKIFWVDGAGRENILGGWG